MNTPKIYFSIQGPVSDHKFMRPVLRSWPRAHDNPFSQVTPVPTVIGLLGIQNFACVVLTPVIWGTVAPTPDATASD